MQKLINWWLINISLLSRALRFFFSVFHSLFLFLTFQNIDLCSSSYFSHSLLMFSAIDSSWFFFYILYVVKGKNLISIFFIQLNIFVSSLRGLYLYLNEQLPHALCLTHTVERRKFLFLVELLQWITVTVDAPLSAAIQCFVFGWSSLSEFENVVRMSGGLAGGRSSVRGCNGWR